MTRPTYHNWQSLFLFTMPYKLWTHREVITPLLHFYIVDPVGTVTARDSANSQTCRKWGNVWNLVKLHTLVKISKFCILWYMYDRAMFSKMQHLPSFKFFTSSKICTATCVIRVHVLNETLWLSMELNHDILVQTTSPRTIDRITCMKSWFTRK